MKQISKYILVLSLVAYLVSCAEPGSKEEYLEKFVKFVNRVEENHKDYNKKDWEWADSKFSKFKKEWYQNFKEEYTIEEQIKIKGLIIEYNSYKNNEDFGTILKELFQDDVDDIKGKVEEYIDKDMDEDLEKLIEGASEIGDSAVKVLEEIIIEIERSF